MKTSTKFSLVTGVAAGMALASGAWVMWGAWTVLSIVGTLALRKKGV